MPVAMPTWRKVELTPEAIPDAVRGDHADRGGGQRRVDQADAEPGDREAGDEVGPRRVGLDAADEQQADAQDQEAGTDQPLRRHLLR